MTLARPSLVCLLSLCAAACSSDVMLGEVCARPDCQATTAAVAGETYYWPDMPAPGTPCSTQLSTLREPVGADRELDHCEIFPLEGQLDTAAGTRAVYLTQARLLMTPASHHVDVRMAPDVRGLGSGHVSCAEVWSRDIEWVPLLAARGERDYWAYAAPLTFTTTHHVLINHHYINTQTHDAVGVGVKLNLSCTERAPAVVSQSFVFENRREARVDPGTDLEVVSEAHFGKDVLVTFLHRRTHLIERFKVERIDAVGNTLDTEWEVTGGNTAWKHTPERPIEMAAGEGFRFSCYYLNADSDIGDRVLLIGGSSSDACALLGTYELPDGSPDPTPERVVTY